MSRSTPPLPVGYATFGDAATHSELRLPGLNPDGSIHLVPADGGNIGTTKAKFVSHLYREWVGADNWAEILNTASKQHRTEILHDMDVLVTDARLIVYSPDQQGRLTVGQLWYPWIRAAGFRPKQSFVYDAVLELVYLADFPADDGYWEMTLQLQFDKTFHPGPLAWDVARRIAAHNLQYGAPAEAHPRLAQMADPPALPDPPKGEVASYPSGAYVTYPGGVPHVDGGPDRCEWIVQEFTWPPAP